MVRSVRQIRDELKRRLDPVMQRRFAEERRAAIAEYERRYGIRSDEVHQAIEDGWLEQTLEVNEPDPATTRGTRLPLESLTSGARVW